MICLKAGLSNKSNLSKLGNSNYPMIGKILLKGTPDELVNTFIMSLGHNAMEKEVFATLQSLQNCLNKIFISGFKMFCVA